MSAIDCDLLAIGAGSVNRYAACFVSPLDARTGQDVVVVGGGDGACDWTLTLERTPAR